MEDEPTLHLPSSVLSAAPEKKHGSRALLEPSLLGITESMNNVHLEPIWSERGVRSRAFRDYTVVEHERAVVRDERERQEAASRRQADLEELRRQAMRSQNAIQHTQGSSSVPTGIASGVTRRVGPGLWLREPRSEAHQRMPALLRIREAQRHSLWVREIDINPALGRLSRLPPELRDMVYEYTEYAEEVNITSKCKTAHSQLAMASKTLRAEFTATIDRTRCWPCQHTRFFYASDMFKPPTSLPTTDHDYTKTRYLRIKCEDRGVPRAIVTITIPTDVLRKAKCNVGGAYAECYLLCQCAALPSVERTLDNYSTKSTAEKQVSFLTAMCSAERAVHDTRSQTWKERHPWRADLPASDDVSYFAFVALGTAEVALGVGLCVCLLGFMWTIVGWIVKR